MNIRDLKYLIALIDYKHFGKAAEACFVSQPALSIQIKKLEDELGVQLFERTHKSLLLTEVGMNLAKIARNILIEVEEMQEIAKLAQDPYCHELKIGIIPTIAPYLLPHIIPKLSIAFPKLKLYLIEEKTAVIVAKLKEGHLDTIVAALPLIEEGLVTYPLFVEEFVFAMPAGHPFAKRKILKQEELADEHLLLLEEGHCLREQALTACHLIKDNEFKNFRATSLETLRYMIASGIGITLMPKLACKKNDGIAYVKTMPKFSRTIGMLWRESCAKKNFLKEIASYLKKMIVEEKILK